MLIWRFSSYVDRWNGNPLSYRTRNIEIWIVNRKRVVTATSEPGCSLTDESVRWLSHFRWSVTYDREIPANNAYRHINLRIDVFSSKKFWSVTGIELVTSRFIFYRRVCLCTCECVNNQTHNAIELTSNETDSTFWFL